MDRRTFLGVAPLVVLLGARPLGAQPAGKVWRIGVLVHGESLTPEQMERSPFRTTLRELGWIEGQNIAFEDRRSTQVPPLDALAAELVASNVDVIVTTGTPAARAAKRATSQIPVVVIIGGDPVASGLVASLARPGGNITGLTALSEELLGKRLEVMKELLPKLSRVAYMWNPANPGNVDAANSFKTVAVRMNVRAHSVQVRGPDELDGAFGSMVSQRVGALLVAADGMLLLHRTRIAELAAKHRVPTMYSTRAHVEAGGLILYSVDWNDLHRHAGLYVDKILKGAAPADLPMAQPTKYELLVNAKAAKALGLTIPPSIMMRVDRVVE
jgi:putative ABC transport system substrate-binding protein